MSAKRDGWPWVERAGALLSAYRDYGHLAARLSPLQKSDPTLPPILTPSYYGFTDEELDRPLSGGADDSSGGPSLRERVARLREVYCGTVGVEMQHVTDDRVRNWVIERWEGDPQLTLSVDERKQILALLTRATVFEEFIQKKYVGAKSFSLEGGETLIPLLDRAIAHAAGEGVEEIVIGMAHRGRLNVLANVIGKKPEEIFREFEDDEPRQHQGAGDVKYHLGHSADVLVDGREVHLSLCFNPSHLEYVNPVALGRVRAKQDRRGDRQRRRVMPLLVHGDAAFAGEGVVQEALNLSELPAYSVSGALHIIINNQIGFTTPPEEGRSSVYCTGVARLLESPIFHVNGEDPDAVAHVLHVAMDFRRAFQRDVIIDLYGYRRQGHNESDEPSFTQPRAYAAIEDRPSPRDIYLKRLVAANVATEKDADAIGDSWKQTLDREFDIARRRRGVPRERLRPGIWAGYLGGRESHAPEVVTGVAKKRLIALLQRLTRLPDGFEAHRGIERLIKRRRDMASGERALDWATAEALAFASLATEGIHVRLSGQDARRGTFSQRHAAFHDVTTSATFEPLNHLVPGQASVEIYNSPLNEAGTLGFEYGYSLDAPDGLVLWEAQFGDFSNAAQVIIDQFISSAEDKWNRLSGLVMLLPHGLEGQGPEHASARLERLLVLSAEDNLQIAYPTTPAQYFHVLRRQVLRPLRKPLVVLTPKSMLRHKEAVSSLNELADGAFAHLLGEGEVRPGDVRRILLSSGKVYYDLKAQREALGRTDVALLRLEQLYPLDDAQWQEVLAPFRDGTPVVWVQEEPENMGAWRFLRTHWGRRILDRLPFRGVFRPESASPATGSRSSHQFEQKQLIDRAFGDHGEPA